VGRNLGELAGLDVANAPIVADPVSVISGADAVIDFTSPAVSVDLAGLCAQARIVHVVGTTGLDAIGDHAIRAAARHATIIRSGNMSLGVNLLAGLVEIAAKALGSDFDAEILEMHHRFKVDAPSGTALLLAEAVARARGASLEELRMAPYNGLTGARPSSAIGFASVRGGSIVGDHTVILAGDGERLELTHRAEDRSVFARGAVAAAIWGQGKGPGHFDMQDVLGLRMSR
jgi:4-hydroxy-tetrahydrodipicolinate reductase